MNTLGTPYRKAELMSGDFDAIVIGSGMGGMSVASLLAQDGQRVLLLEQHNVIGGLTQSYERAGYRWTIGLHYIGDVESQRSMTRKLFDSVTNDGVEWALMPSIFNRMMIGEHEYRIPAGLEPYRNALKTWFPNDGEAIDAYLTMVQRISKQSAAFFAMKSFPLGISPDELRAASEPFLQAASQVTIDAISSLTTNPELIAVLCANWGDYGIEPNRSSFAMHCMLSKHYLNGGSYPTGGGQALANAIVPIIEEAGGLVVHSAEVSRILVNDGNVQGVRMASGEEIHCPVVISNAGVRNSFGRLLSEEDRGAHDLDNKLSSVTDSYAVVGLNIGLDASADTLGLEAANIWAHPNPDLVGNLAAHREDFDAPFAWTFITFPSVKDPSWEKEFPNKATVEMYACTDYRHYEQWANTRWRKRGAEYDQRKREIQKRLLDDLYRLVPRTRGHVAHVEVSTPLTYETFGKRQRGDFMGVESSPSRFQQDWLRAHTPIRGLYLTGQDVSTDGVIGALVGGVICASAVLGRDMMTEIRVGRTREVS